MKRVAVQWVIALAVWYAAFFVSLKVLGEYHTVTYVLQVALLPLLLVLLLRTARAIIAAVRKPRQ